MQIAMVGTGYVGLVTGTCFANTGNNVRCIDIDRAKIDQLNRGEQPIYEPFLGDLMRRNVEAGRLHFTLDGDAAYQWAQMIFICVGTPSDEHGRADVSQVLTVARQIGEAIEAVPGPTGAQAGERRAKIIVVKSTVPVGTGARVKAQMAAVTSKPFHVSSNPEFLKEGAAISDFNRPDRVVIGVEDEGTGRRLVELYDPFVRQGNPVYVMDISSAEMVKYASNAMLATKISFVNEIANLCESHGADIDQVRRGMCSDKRIGNQFLYPGLGYGGSCFPKDVLACIAMGADSQTPTTLLSAVDRVNQQQRIAFLRKIARHFGGPDADCGGSDRPDLTAVAGLTVAIWGIAFKPGTDDIRQAPAIMIIEQLLEHGARVVGHDPVALHRCREVFADRVAYTTDPYHAVAGADALIICTDWDEFKHPDFELIKQRMNRPVIFDGRNLYRRQTMNEYGFTYYSVGRDPVGGPGP